MHGKSRTPLIIVVVAVAAFAAGFAARRVLDGGTPKSPDVPQVERPETVAERYEATAVAPTRTEELGLGAVLPPPALGADEPLTTVFVCTSFPCSACARAARAMRPLMERYKDRVRFEFRNSAPAHHRVARRAAMAGVAAHRQGRFFHMYDAMFNDPENLSEVGVRECARRSGLNLERFESDMRDPAIEAHVEAETGLCLALGAAGTPSFFFNGERSDGWGGEKLFEQLLARHLERAALKLAAGTPRTDLIRAMAQAYASEPEKYIRLVVNRPRAAPSR